MLSILKILTLLDIIIVSKALLYELNATFNVVVWHKIINEWVTFIDEDKFKYTFKEKFWSR